jgi:hypothetical protein
MAAIMAMTITTMSTVRRMPHVPGGTSGACRGPSSEAGIGRDPSGAVHLLRARLPPQPKSGANQDRRTIGRGGPSPAGRRRVPVFVGEGWAG